MKGKWKRAQQDNRREIGRFRVVWERRVIQVRLEKQKEAGHSGFINLR